MKVTKAEWGRLLRHVTADISSREGGTFNTEKNGEYVYDIKDAEAVEKTLVKIMVLLKIEIV